MPARQLAMRRVEKPWGRQTLGGVFADAGPGEGPIGEVWFEDGDPQADLLVKYLFTSERLSIQVHPDDVAAKTAGFARGKDEAWVVLDAEPGATIAIGTKGPTDHSRLRSAAEAGDIVSLLAWHPVKAGDVFYSPAGTIHAIGAGITLVEVQQNVDLTYRLYDYGRPRDLHLDAGIAVSDPKPFVPNFAPERASADRTILCEGPKFVLESWQLGADRLIVLPDAVPGWFVPLSGRGEIDGEPWSAGEAWRIAGQAMLGSSQGEALFAYPLGRRIDPFGPASG
jgi:mannose-6-phosphate isomerase